MYTKYGYVVDPHTACGFSDLGSGPNLVLSTAHPAKFPDTIREAIDIDSTHSSLEALKAEEVVKYKVEPTPEGIKAFMREHV